MPVLGRMSNISFVDSPTYVNNKPLRTTGSNSRRLISRFSKWRTYFVQRCPTVAVSWCGLKGAKGGKPLRGTCNVIVAFVAFVAVDDDAFSGFVPSASVIILWIGFYPMLVATFISPLFTYS